MDHCKQALKNAAKRTVKRPVVDSQKAYSQIHKGFQTKNNLNQNEEDSYFQLHAVLIIEDYSTVKIHVVLNLKKSTNLEFLEDKGQLPSHKLHDHNLLIEACRGSGGSWAKCHILR